MKNLIKTYCFLFILLTMALFAVSCSKDEEDYEAGLRVRLEMVAMKLYKSAEMKSAGQILDVIEEESRKLFDTPPEDISGLQERQEEFPPYKVLMCRSHDEGSEAVDFFVQILQDDKEIIIIKGFVEVDADVETENQSYGECHVEARLQNEISIVGNSSDPARAMQLICELFDAYQNKRDTKELLKELELITEYTLFA